MNVALLENIKTHILAEPDAFRMDVWSCGTAHCIAGWALVLTGHRIVDITGPMPMQTIETGEFVQPAAMRELGISDDQANALFNTCEWPPDFLERAETSDGDLITDRAELAEVAAERIDHFIATGGDE